MKGILIITLSLLLFQFRATSQNIGMHTTAPLAKLHVDLGSSLANGVIFTGPESSSGGTFPSLGAGNRMMYYPMKSVFRAGYVDGTQWDNANVGSYSFAFGYNPIARSPGTFAAGDAVTAGGWISTAFGNSTITKGYSSFVLGMYNDPLIPGADEFAETPMTPLLMVGNGDGGATRNNALTVFKNGAVLLKNYSTVLVDPGIKLPPVSGPGTRMMWMPEKSALRIGTVNNNYWDADSIGTWSTATGYNTIAKGSVSVAMGYLNSATGDLSTAMGALTKASGMSSTALGNGTLASGISSTAMGYSTVASGENAMAMGSVTTAKGANSTAIGFNTYAGSYGSVALGRYNDTIVNSNQTAWVPADPLLMIGNGTADATPHNAMVVYKNGNMVLKNPMPFFYEKLPANYGLPIEGEGTRMMWIPGIGAFRAGSVIDSAWNQNKVGGASFATGVNATASGFISMAAGFDTKASGGVSTAFGYGNITRGLGSLVIGVFNEPILSEDEETEPAATSPLFIVGNGDDYDERHNALVVRKDGHVGIGTDDPSSELHIAGAITITDGTQGAGKILTSNEVGLASWQSPPPPPAEPAIVQSVSICCQSWMTKNLDVSTYRNGDPIPKVTSDAAWAALTTGAYCYYNNDSTTYAAVYGKMYNWYAINDPRGLAPDGWHIPTAFEFTTLSECLGGSTVGGGPLKEMGTAHWNSPNSGATNVTGFTAVGGGVRSSAGAFVNVGTEVAHWGATEFSATNAWYLSLVSFSQQVTVNNFAKKAGFYLRCIRD